MKISTFNRTLLRKTPLLIILMALGLTFVANVLANEDSSSQLAPQATIRPNEQCTTIYQTSFPFGDTQVIRGYPYTLGVTIGGEDYTSTPRGTNGVRLRDFRDSLDPATRPGGVNYADQWIISA